MREGDTVNVLRSKAFGGVEKTLARVIEVKEDKFAVESMRGPFDDEGHDRMWLEIAAKGRTWE